MFFFPSHLYICGTGHQVQDRLQLPGHLGLHAGVMGTFLLLPTVASLHLEVFFRVVFAAAKLQEDEDKGEDAGAKDGWDDDPEEPCYGKTLQAVATVHDRPEHPERRAVGGQEDQHDQHDGVDDKPEHVLEDNVLHLVVCRQSAGRRGVMLMGLDLGVDDLLVFGNLANTHKVHPDT